MAHAPTVVGVSGSLTTPSRTTVLVDEVTRAFADATGGTPNAIGLAPLLGDLGVGPFRSHLSPRVLAALEAVESADIIVVGSPAYRSTYTGLFKLFFDHIDQYALLDKPVVLTATGGSDRHALFVEHQMRPLFGFFQSLTLPLGIYASEADFEDYAIASDDLLERIATAVTRTLPLVRSRVDPEARDTGAEFARPDAF
ncbi:FMN reductase [Leifsonia xyli subsp. xyli]|nr:FMN reductase [Leifsonia xyli]ODA89798.1 FMN reductase [Leifsonia xyli subsp. xyli]